jgi:hypothetical protein
VQGRKLLRPTPVATNRCQLRFATEDFPRRLIARGSGRLLATEAWAEALSLCMAARESGTVIAQNGSWLPLLVICGDFWWGSASRQRGGAAAAGIRVAFELDSASPSLTC